MRVGFVDWTDAAKHEGVSRIVPRGAPTRTFGMVLSYEKCFVVLHSKSDGDSLQYEYTVIPKGLVRKVRTVVFKEGECKM